MEKAMSQLYARVFLQILDSSLAENWQARHVFEDLMKLSDDGIVDMTREAISRRTNIPLDVINAAIAILESPDPDSRDPEEDGRRLLRLDEHRDWGWRIVNSPKYEAIRSKEDQRIKTADRVRRHREKKSPLASPKETTDPSPDPDPEEALQKRYMALHGVTSTLRSAEPPPTYDDDWMKTLQAALAYQGIDVIREFSKMTRWCEVNRKQPTRRRFVNWLNRIERPIAAPSIPAATSTASAYWQSKSQYDMVCSEIKAIEDRTPQDAMRNMILIEPDKSNYAKLKARRKALRQELHLS
jgi:hypothetical protein